MGRCRYLGLAGFGGSGVLYSHCLKLKSNCQAGHRDGLGDKQRIDGLTEGEMSILPENERKGGQVSG